MAPGGRGLVREVPVLPTAGAIIEGIPATGRTDVARIRIGRERATVRGGAMGTGPV